MITLGFCEVQNAAFRDEKISTQYLSLSDIGEGLNRCIILVMSLWNDHYANVIWLKT